MNRIREPEPEGFDEFWSIWKPHRRSTDGRGDARTAYRKHILMGAEPQDIIDGARAFIRNLSDRDRPYIPLAASWINKEAYADWCESERAYQARISEQQDKSNVVSMQTPKSAFMRHWEAEQAKKAQG